MRPSSQAVQGFSVSQKAGPPERRPAFSFESAGELEAAFQRLGPGETLVFHVGHLAADAHGSPRLLEIAELARRYGSPKTTRVDAGWNTFESERGAVFGLGLGYLTHERVAEFRYRYRLTKKGRRRSPGASF